MQRSCTHCKCPDLRIDRTSRSICAIMESVGTRILAVEDDERIRSAVKLALEDEGWTVDEAESGEQAIELFAAAAPDVVLIDIMLPGIDGFELCRTDIGGVGERIRYNQKR